IQFTPRRRARDLLQGLRAGDDARARNELGYAEAPLPITRGLCPAAGRKGTVGGRFWRPQPSRIRTGWWCGCGGWTGCGGRWVWLPERSGMGSRIGALGNPGAIQLAWLADAVRVATATRVPMIPPALPGSTRNEAPR